MQRLRIVLAAGLFTLLYAPAAFASGELNPNTTDYTPISMPVPSASIASPVSEMTGTGDVLTRAQFVSMVVDKLYTQKQIDTCFWVIGSTNEITFSLLFSDVSIDSPHAKELCVAMHDGIARGFSDGSFRPNRSITFEEAAKIIARAYTLVPLPDVKEAQAAFRPYIEALADKHAIPMTVSTFHQRLQNSEGSEMITRIADGVTWMPSRSYADLERLSTPVMLPVVQSDVPSRSPIGGNSSAKSSGSSSSAVPWYKFF